MIIMSNLKLYKCVLINDYYQIEIIIWIHIIISKKKKVGDRSRRWTEGSLFDSYYTKV